MFSVVSLWGTFSLRKAKLVMVWIFGWFDCHCDDNDLFLPFDYPAPKSTLLVVLLAVEKLCTGCEIAKKTLMRVSVPI